MEAAFARRSLAGALDALVIGGAVVEALSGEQLVIEFELKQSDLVKAQFWWLSRHWSLRFLYAMVVICMLSVVLFPSKGDPLGTFPLAGMFAWWFVLLPLLVARGGTSLYRKLKPHGLAIWYEFSSAGVKTRTALGEASFRWAALDRVMESSQAFYLFAQKDLFHVIPRRAFVTEGMVGQLRALARDNLGKGAVLLEKVRT